MMLIRTRSTCLFLVPLLLRLHISHVSSQQTTTCPSDWFNNNWFGPNCQYMCHCNNKLPCTTIGDCPSGCDIGWFGPACQYADVMQTGSVNILGAVNPDLVKDGNEDTCVTSSTGNFSLQVTWNSSNIFTWLRVVAADSKLVKKAAIKFTETTNPDAPILECTTRKTILVTNRTIDFLCSAEKTFQQLYLYGTGLGTICSVYISGGRNLALKQLTRQTSFYLNSTSSAAVDGITSGKFEQSSCTHTDFPDKTPKWTLQFSQEYMFVQGIKIYNREDCCTERLKGFILDTYDRLYTNAFHYVDPSTAQAVYRIYLPHAVQVSTVEMRATFEKNGTNEVVLTICEMEVYGDAVCPVDLNSLYTYGRGCERRCNCAVEDEMCTVWTGNCPSGCKAGFYGEGCNTSCEPASYGVDCQQICSTNCKDQLCDPRSGHCFQCAVDGRRTPLCLNSEVSSPDDQPKNSIGIGIGIGIGISCVVGIVIAITVFMVHKRRQGTAVNERQPKPQAYDQVDERRGSDHRYNNTATIDNTIPNYKDGSADSNRTSNNLPPSVNIYEEVKMDDMETTKHV